MPVFALIATKMKAALPRQLWEFSAAALGHKVVRQADMEGLTTRVRAAQEYNYLSARCSRKLEEEVSISICGQDDRPRYDIVFCDDPELSTIYLYAVLIVPLGRETEYLFSTAKGRQIIRRICDKHRLGIVRLFRDQDYGTLDNIKNELNAVSVDFAPAIVITSDYRIEYLTLGGDVSARDTVASGTSQINGDWTVEDVKVEERRLRRLLFLTSQNCIQSEALIRKAPSTPSTSSPAPTVDLDVLTCGHHEGMLCGIYLSWLWDWAPATGTMQQTAEQCFRSREWRFCVIGLGAGSLAMFLKRRFAKCKIFGVELDPDVVDIARKYYSLEDDERLTVVVGDAVEYLKKIAEAPMVTNSTLCFLTLPVRCTTTD